MLSNECKRALLLFVNKNLVRTSNLNPLPGEVISLFSVGFLE